MPFPASHKPPEVVEPGQEPFHLRRRVGRTHRPSCVIVSDTRVGWSARKRALRVAWTRCDSFGEALATWTATGRPMAVADRHDLALFSRRAGPTAAPPFSTRRTWRQRSPRTGRFCRDPAGLPRDVGATVPGGRTAATVESVDYRSGTADTGARQIVPRGRRSVRYPEHSVSAPCAVRSTADHDRRLDDADERRVRGRPTVCRRDPCPGYDSRARIVTPVKV